MAAALMLIAGIVRVALFSLSRRSRGEKGAHIHRQIVSAVPNLHQVLITLGGFIGLYEDQKRGTALLITGALGGSRLSSVHVMSLESLRSTFLTQLVTSTSIPSGQLCDQRNLWRVQKLARLQL